MKPENLVGAAEIAERLGVTRPQMIHTWRRRDPTFPLPVAELKQAMIWDWSSVKEWAIRTGRLGDDHQIRDRTDPR